MRTTARRALAGFALAAGLPFAVAGIAYAQSNPGNSGPNSGPDCPSGPSGASGASGGQGCAPSTTTSPTVSVTVTVATPTTRAGTGSGSLSRTGGEWALPLAASGGAVAVVLGSRRLSSRSSGA